jgi:pimeloyl-ACP methyl ester carboxylesterase/DNA-binding CsgD family transcriptional regulator
MMPRVRFARSADGTKIAYSTLGDGPPLVLMPAILFSHLEKLWEIPELRRGLEQLAENWTVVRYDNRGCGLSQRNVTDFSLEAHTSDLEAVAGALRLDQFALNAPMLAGPVGIAFAARNPDRLTHLILQSTVARASDAGPAQSQALLALLEMNWDLFTETAARVMFQWSDEQSARIAPPILRDSVEQEAALGLLRAAVEFDVSDQLPLIQAPTLVIHNRQFPLPIATSRDLASRIPDARLAAVDKLDHVVPAAIEFLSQRTEVVPPRSGRPGPHRETAKQPATPSFDPARLSKREIEILRLVAAGKSNRHIAEELVISTNTVDRHVSHILSKIGAANRAEAAAYAARQRLLA